MRERDKRVLASHQIKTVLNGAQINNSSANNEALLSSNVVSNLEASFNHKKHNTSEGINQIRYFPQYISLGETEFNNTKKEYQLWDTEVKTPSFSNWIN